ncbi:Synaptonemal complex protein 2 [Channa argus]|uniref:Synaptonemal complex protein 2 n=1 Tax=Channa argus TaxID=215402 RepID=A0A6G1Q3A8_CHAAH|nr:Synaptonemal complex protein 2 [Channa argus]
MAKEKSKYQTPLEESVAPNKSSVKLSTTKAKQGKIPGVEAETTEALSSKEKRDAEAAGSMVKLISSHYRFNTRSKGKEITQDFAQNSVPCQINRPSLNISWISAKDKSFVNTSAILSSDNHDSLVLHSTNKKGQPVAKQKKQYVKKHLFSDTDTDCAMTEVSWLRESSRKPRPKVNIYSRQAAAKPKAATPHTSYDSPGLHSTSPKPVKDSTKPKKNSFIGQERKSQKTHSGVSDVKRRKNASKKSTDTYRRVDGNNQSDLKQTCDFKPFQQCLSPAAQSPLSLSTQPLLTSTLLELDKPSMPSPQLPFPEDAANDGSHCGFSKASTVLQDSLSQSSTKSSGLMKRIKYSPTAARAISYKTEKTSSSDSELKPEQFHESVTEMSAKGALDQIVSPAKTVNTSHSEEDVGDGEMEMDEDFEFSEIAVNPTNICQKFSSELKKKFQNRNKMMEIYNKQSLKTVQQHISSLSMHVTKNRAKTLEQIKKVLLEELHKLEQDDTVLKNMEKDLSIYCKKQTMAFHLHQEKNTKRNETLKKALQSNVFPSLEYEQEIFTSQEL